MDDVKRRILMIEDEEGIVVTVSDRLEAEGYRVESASDGDSGFRKASTGEFDVIILDLMLPGRDGLSVCRDLRGIGITTPVLMLTARGQVFDKVLGLKIGADDYMVKPFEMAELLARIEVLIRRGRTVSARDGSSYEIPGAIVDLKAASVRRDGRVIDLTHQECRLLEYFLQNRGEIIDRNELLDMVWGYDAAPATRTVDVHIAALRKKLGDTRSGKIIQTVRSRGYRFTA